MANKTGNKRHLTTALLGGDHFSRQDRRGIKTWFLKYR